MTLPDRLKSSLPGPLRKQLGRGRAVLHRAAIWVAVARELTGVSPRDRQILRKALLSAPVDCFRGLDRWRDPQVADDCRIDSRNIGRFHVRAHCDDLYHILPTRERPIVEALHHWLRPGHVFVDAGANIGVYSVLASRLVGSEGKVISVEMMPDTAAILRRHLMENNCVNATVIESALSRTIGETVTARVSDGKFGQASIATGIGNREISVTTTTLDHILCDCNHVRLMKMDLEGAELFALEGAQKSLEKIDAIVFEDWGGRREKGETPLATAFKDRGFKIRRLDGNNALAYRE